MSQFEPNEGCVDGESQDTGSSLTELQKWLMNNKLGSLIAAFEASEWDDMLCFSLRVMLLIFYLFSIPLNI